MIFFYGEATVIYSIWMLYDNTHGHLNNGIAGLRIENSLPSGTVSQVPIMQPLQSAVTLLLNLLHSSDFILLVL